jgi:dethiobiotin synthetase
MRGVFISGTDTGVGKTYVGTHIAHTLTQYAIKVIPRKPVESGCIRQNNQLIPQDALTLKNAANYSGSLTQVCPYPFEPAISPARAAQLTNKQLHIADLKNACLNGVTENDFLLVEGAGGFYSPLCADGLNADLAQALGLPVLLVVEDRVGCINHVLLTLEAAHRRDVSVTAIVLNRKTATTIEMDNASELTKLTSCEVFPFPEKCDALLTHILGSSTTILPIK